MTKKTKKEKIFEVSAKVFGEKGYDGASLDEIAARAKVAKGTIFYYFKNKEELFLSLIERGLGILTEKINKISSNNNDPKSMKELIECHFLFFRKYRDIGMMMLSQLGYLKKRWNKKLEVARNNYVKAVKKIIIDEKGRGLVADDLEMEGIIVSLFSLLVTMGLDWSVFGLKISTDKMSKTIREIIFRGIR